MTAPTRGHLTQVAKQIQKRLGVEPFVTIGRREVTEMVRAVSGDGTRLTSAMAAGLENVLGDQGIRCFPSLQVTTTRDVIRFYPTVSTLGEVVELLCYPDAARDAELTKVLTKTRPIWKSTPLGGA